MLTKSANLEIVIGLADQAFGSIMLFLGQQKLCSRKVFTVGVAAFNSSSGGRCIQENL